MATIITQRWVAIIKDKDVGYVRMIDENCLMHVKRDTIYNHHMIISSEGDTYHTLKLVKRLQTP